jgi:hypothetical protein
MKKTRKKQMLTTAPKPKIGKKKTGEGHGMDGAFGATPKRPVTEDPPRTRKQERTQRMKRLAGYRL